VLGKLKALWDGATGTGSGQNFFKKTQTAFLNQVQGVSASASSLRKYTAGDYTRATANGSGGALTVQDGGDHSIAAGNSILRTSSSYTNTAQNNLTLTSSSKSINLNAATQVRASALDIKHLASRTFIARGDRGGINIGSSINMWSGSDPDTDPGQTTALDDDGFKVNGKNVTSQQDFLFAKDFGGL